MPIPRRPLLYILLAVIYLWPWLVAAQSTPDQRPVITTPTVAALLPTPTPTADTTQNIERTYIVQPADTMLSVAVEIGIDLADVPCLVSPTFQATQPLVIGDRLTVPASDVLCHAVRPDESIKVIAELYSADPVDIFNESWNQLSVNQIDLDPTDRWGVICVCHCLMMIVACAMPSVGADELADRTTTTRCW